MDKDLERAKRIKEWRKKVVKEALFGIDENDEFYIVDQDRLEEKCQ